MISKIKIHMFFGTMVAMFGWYYLVDTLPRSRLIPDYVTTTAVAAQQAAAKGELTTLAVAQPMFYLDNPVVSVGPGEGDAVEIRFSQASKRRCDQITSNATVKQVATRIVISGGICGDANEVTLVVPAKG